MATLSAVGFNDLPLEIRSKVYGNLLNGFCQALVVIPQTGDLLKDRFSPRLPPCLAVRSTFSTEAMPCLMFDRTAEVSLTAERFKINFPLGKQGRISIASNDVKLPLCRNFAIDLQVPSPRNARDMIGLRHNVGLFAQWLNRYEFEGLPIIHITISNPSISVNDFSMVTGPFVKVRKPCNAIKLHTNPENVGMIVKKWRAATEKLLNATIENKLFIYEQLILDTKLPIYEFRDRFEYDSYRRRFRFVPPTELYQWAIIQISQGVVALRDFCAQHRLKEHAWIAPLMMVDWSLGTPKKTRVVLDMVMGTCDLKQVMLWPAGFVTVHNPFLGEDPVFKQLQVSSM